MIPVAISSTFFHMIMIWLITSILETFKTYLRLPLCNLLLPLSCSLCLTLRTTLASLLTGQISQTTNLESQPTKSLCGSMTHVKQTVVQHWSTIGWRSVATPQNTSLLNSHYGLVYWNFKTIFLMMIRHFMPLDSWCWNWPKL